MDKIKLSIVFIICFYSGLFSSNLLYAADIGSQKDDYDLGRVVVISDRWGKPEYRLGSNVSVIDKKKIEESGANNVADLLAGEPSINVSSYSQTRKNTFLDIRGFGEASPTNVLVLVDGRRINQIDISGVDWWQIPAKSVERIEIIRGAASVLYGDNATGGAINIVTKKGEGKLKAKVSSSYGSYNMDAHDTEITGSLDKFSYYFYSRYYDTDGYRDNDNLLSKDFNSRIGFEPDERMKFDLNLGLHTDKYGLPGPLSIANFELLGRRGSAYPNDYAYTKDKYIRLETKVRPLWGSLEMGDFISDITLRKRESYSSLIAFGTNSTTLHDIDSLSITAKYRKELDIFNRNTVFITGLDFYNADDIIESRGYSIDDITITKESKGFFVLLDTEISDDLFLDTGYRMEKNNYVFDQDSPSLRYEEKNPRDSVFSSKLLYNYKVNSNVYLGYEESFHFPATDEWYSIFAATGLNTNLKPQAGKQYELGLKHEFNHKLKANANLYLVDIKDEIFYNPSTYANENYSETRRKGLEAGFEAKPFKWMTFFSNYTYQVPKFRRGDYDGKEIPAVPNNLASLGAKFVFLDYFNLSLNSKYVGSRYLISDQQNQAGKLKHYLTLDSRISYNRESLELFFALNNIFNQRYSEIAVTNSTGTAKNFYPSPERNFVIGINYRF